MLKVSAAFLSLMALSACASQPLPLATLPLPERAKPLEALQVPSPIAVFDQCRLKGFAELPLEEQAQQLRQCIEQLGPAYRDLLKRHAALADWIRTGSCTDSSQAHRPQ